MQYCLVEYSDTALNSEGRNHLNSLQMKSVLLLILCFPMMADAQTKETDALYFNLGIKTMKMLEANEKQKRFILEADSTYFNGVGMTLDKIQVYYSQENNGITLSIGKNFQLLKKDDLNYNLTSGSKEISIDLEKKSNLQDKELDARFVVMAILLNLIKANDLSEFSYTTIENSGITGKRCGTWEVTGYGHSQTGSMLNALQQAESFENNNANCSQSGGASVTCIKGEHFCFTTYTFYCKCRMYIPFIGLGWD